MKYFKGYLVAVTLAMLTVATQDSSAAMLADSGFEASLVADSSIEMRIEYRDAVGEISRKANLDSTLTSTDYELVTMSDTIAAGSTARTELAISELWRKCPSIAN